MNTGNKISAVDFKANLSEFIGTFQYHTHRIGKLCINLTDGCDYVRKEAEAFWLFDFNAGVNHYHFPGKTTTT